MNDEPTTEIPMRERDAIRPQSGAGLPATPSNITLSIVFAIALLISFAFLGCLDTINTLQNNVASTSRLGSLLLEDTNNPFLFQLQTLFMNVPPFTSLFALLIPPFVLRTYRTPRGRDFVLIGVSFAVTLAIILASAFVQTGGFWALFKTPLAGILTMFSVISITALLSCMLMKLFLYISDAHQQKCDIKPLISGIILALLLGISIVYLTDLGSGFEQTLEATENAVLEGTAPQVAQANVAAAESMASRMGSVAFPLGNAFPFNWLLLTLIPWLCAAASNSARRTGVSLLKPSRRTTPLYIGAFLIALAIVLSSSLARAHTLLALWQYPLDILLTLLSVLAFCAVIYTMLFVFFRFVQDFSQKSADPNTPLFTPQLAQVQYLIVFAILIVAWLPYLLAFAPGSAENDITRQLAQFLGMQPLTDHHPVLSTYIYGFVFSLGYNAAGANAGLMLVVLMQTIALAVACTFQVYVVKSLRAPRWVAILMICFFALTPVFGTFAQFAGKDTLFAAVFAVYVGLFVLYLKDPRSFSSSIGKMIAFALVAILVGLIRHNGFYAVLFSMPFLVFAHLRAPAGAGCDGEDGESGEGGERDSQCDADQAFETTAQHGEGGKQSADQSTSVRPSLMKKLLPLVAVVIAIPCLGALLVSASGAERGSVAEMLSIPMQQVARVAHDDPDAIAEADRAVLARTFGETEIGPWYDPTISDPVKSYFERGASVSEFMGAWASIGRAHPLAYADALGEMTYGYWAVQTVPTYGEEWTYFMQTTHSIDWSRTTSAVVLQNAESVIDILRAIPLIGLLTQAGFYTWLLLIMMAYLIATRRPRCLIALLPAIVFVLTCMLGPVNGDIRYMLPVIAAMPALVTYVFIYRANRANRP